ncbi:hypothetical protein SCA6_018833 [Theobroma cacao]
MEPQSMVFRGKGYGARTTVKEAKNKFSAAGSDLSQALFLIKKSAGNIFRSQNCILAVSMEKVKLHSSSRAAYALGRS